MQSYISQLKWWKWVYLLVYVEQFVFQFSIRRCGFEGWHGQITFKSSKNAGSTKKNKEKEKKINKKGMSVRALPWLAGGLAKCIEHQEERQSLLWEDMDEPVWLQWEWYGCFSSWSGPCEWHYPWNHNGLGKVSKEAGCAFKNKWNFLTGIIQFINLCIAKYHLIEQGDRCLIECLKLRWGQ